MTKNKFEIKPYQKLLKQIKFEKARNEYTDKEIQMELLYINSLIFEQLQKNQKNTSTIKTIIIVYLILSIIIGLLFGLEIIK